MTTIKPKLTGSLRTRTTIQAKSVTLGTISASELVGADTAFSINLLSDQGTDLIKLLSDNNLSILGSTGIQTSIDAETNTLTITLLPASNTNLGGAKFDSSYFTIDSDGLVSITPGGISASQLATNSFTIGSSEIALGDAIDRINGLTSLEVGTITGNTVWDGATIPTSKGGTGLVEYIKGDILFASDNNVLQILPIGAEGEFLAVSSSGVPYWSNEIDGGSF